MAEIPTTEPLSVYAGDTVRWTKSLPDYPASSGWALSYTLLNAASKITLSSTPQGDDFAVVASAATTNSWAPGEYAWRAQVSLAGNVFTVGEGRMTVQPSFGAATLDTRTSARKALESVEAYLQDSQNLTAAEYQINGRQLRRHSMSELWAHRDRLRFEVSKEDAAARVAAGLPDGRRVYVRFGQ